MDYLSLYDSIINDDESITLQLLSEFEFNIYDIYVLPNLFMLAYENNKIIVMCELLRNEYCIYYNFRITFEKIILNCQYDILIELLNSIMNMENNKLQEFFSAFVNICVKYDDINAFEYVIEYYSQLGSPIIFYPKLYKSTKMMKYMLENFPDRKQFSKNGYLVNTIITYHELEIVKLLLDMNIVDPLDVFKLSCKLESIKIIDYILTLPEITMEIILINIRYCHDNRYFRVMKHLNDKFNIKFTIDGTMFV